jgi:3-methyladenine DNA glycosylase AlkD
MNDYTKKLITLLSANADAEKAKAMSAYLKNNFPFFGIKSPERVSLLKQFLNENKPPQYSEVLEIVSELFNQPQRELHYCAIKILEKRKKEWRKQDIDFFEKMIVTSSWWDSVDTISSALVGEYFIKYPEQIRPITEKWMASNNIWLQRVCLIFQLSYKNKTDFALLMEYTLQLKDSNEFFIQKAIGWALRQYAKFEPEKVKNFVENNALKPLSKREALKHISKDFVV